MIKDFKIETVELNKNDFEITYNYVDSKDKLIRKWQAPIWWEAVPPKGEGRLFSMLRKSEQKKVNWELRLGFIGETPFNPDPEFDYVTLGTTEGMTQEELERYFEASLDYFAEQTEENVKNRYGIK